MTGIDVTLDGETYTLTSQKDGKERTWLCGEAEIEIGDLRDALEALTAEEFTSEKAAGQQEISLTLHLDHEDEPELTITLYRCDGSKCLAVVDGKSFMEIFCLRLSGPITVHAECTEEEFHRFFQESQRFLLL